MKVCLAQMSGKQKLNQIREMLQPQDNLNICAFYLEMIKINRGASVYKGLFNKALQ